MQWWLIAGLAFMLWASLASLIVCSSVVVGGRVDRNFREHQGMDDGS